MLIKEAKFTLDKPNSTEPTYIFLRYSCTDGQLVYSTQQAIHPSEWDSEYQRPKGKANKKLFSEIERIAKVVADYRDSCKDKFEPVTKEGLINELQKYNIGKKINVKPEPVKQPDLFPAFLRIIEDAEAGTYLNPENGRKFEDGTIQTWRRLLILFANITINDQKVNNYTNSKDGRFKKDTVTNWKNFKTFMETVKPKLYFDDITEEWHKNKFMQFCVNRGHSVNYIGVNIMILKRLMRECIVRGLHANMAFEKFKNIYEHVRKVYLEEHEVERLYNLDINKLKLDKRLHKQYEEIRDRYIIQIYAALRISDMKKLTLDHFYSNKNRIILLNKKTGNRVEVPIHPITTDIIEKYGGKLPKQYSENKVNEVIKILCKEAGINEEIRYVKTIGGRKVEFVEEKWKLVSSHTARRTGGSNLSLYMQEHQAATLLGITTRTFQKHYNRITPEANADFLQNNEYFNRKSI
jgi:integrase